MLEVIKQMNHEGIFKLLPNNELCNTIKDIDFIDDSILKDVQRYLNNLVQMCQYKHNIDISNNISEFYDKFFDEMFDVRFTYEKYLNGIYQKNIKYGDAGVFTFGISGLNSTFSFDERKLLKLIDHYYISLHSKQEFNDHYFFIPFNRLKLIFPKINNVKLKSKIEKACSSLNDKVIYWDFSKNHYKQDLNKDNLYLGDGEKIVDISIINYPKQTIAGETIEMKGIICKISKFMKVRYNLNQISNIFPLDCFRFDYLGFMITEKLNYRAHMCRKKSKCKQNLRKLLDSIYVYENGIQTNRTYLYRVINEANSKRTLLMCFEDIIVSLYNLAVNRNFKPYLEIHNKLIDLSEYVESVNHSNVSFLADSLYNSITNGKSFRKKALVKDLIVAGEIALVLDFKCTNEF